MNCNQCRLKGHLYYCYRCCCYYCHEHIPLHIYTAICSGCRQVICLDLYNRKKCIECDVHRITNQLDQLTLPQTDTLTPMLNQLKL